MAVLNNRNLHDHDLDGGIDSAGIIKQNYDREAVENAVKLWLLSYQGDFVANPNKGGILIPFITKPMTDTRAESMKESVITYIGEDFQGDLVVLDLQILPNYEKRYWTINMTGYSNSFQVGFSFTEKVRNLA